MFSEHDADRLIELLTTYSCRVAKGDGVVIESIDAPPGFVKRLTEKICAMGAVPYVQEKTHAGMASFATMATEAMWHAEANREVALMQKSKHFIGIRRPDDANCFKKVPADKLKLLLEIFIKPVHYNYRNHHLDWVYLRSPTPQMIEASGMNEAAFWEYYCEAMLLNYAQLDSLLEPLKQRLEKATSVRITGPGETDLRFELDGYGVYKSIGKHNLPDGEISTAPAKDSVNGLVEFNIASTYYNTHFENIRLKFENGRVTEAFANDSKKLNEFLDIDKGARYVGEFSLGVNPVIRQPVNDILFDEKMFGSLHLALGNAYPGADNGNRSAIHWDLIVNQTVDGGFVYFDDELIRENGLFLPPDLQALNFGIKK